MQAPTTRVSIDRRKHTTAIVPCKNGEDSVAGVVAALKAEVLIDEVIVVDDGSSDDTARIAAGAGAQVVRLKRNRGKGAAMRAGIDAAPNADIFLFVDADTAATAGAAVKLLDPVLSGEAGLVVGVLPSAGRRGGLGSVKRLAAWGIRAACGFSTRAPLSGQRAVTSSLIHNISLAERFAVEVAMTIDAVRSGAVVEEIDVEMEHHHRGRSIDGFWHRGKQGVDVVRALWPRLVARHVRMGLAALSAAALFALLLLAPGTRGDDAGTALPGVKDVSVVIVPGWLWPDEGGSFFEGAAAASIVTGNVKDVVNAVAAGSRNPEASPVPDIDVQVETPNRLAEYDPTSVSPGRTVITVGVTTHGKDPALRPLMITAPGVSGTLASPSTRVTGLVDLTDIAPTVLAMQGRPVPNTMEGSVLRVRPDVPVDIPKFVALDNTSRFYSDIKPAVISTYVVTQVLLFAAAFYYRVRRGMLPVWIIRGSLAVAAAPVATYLIRWWSGGDSPGALAWSALIALGLGMIVAMSSVRASDAVVQLQRILLLTIAVIVGDVLSGGHLQASGIFGTSPLLGTRYFGLGNPATTLLLTATVLWSALHVARSHQRGAPVTRVALLLVVVLSVIGMPGLGADGGGLIAAVLCAVLLIGSLARGSLPWKQGALAMLLAIAAAAAVAFIDQLRPAAAQTHLGRFAEQVMTNGGSVLVEVATRRLDANIFGYGFPYSLVVVAIAAGFLLGLLRHRCTGALPEGTPQRAGVIVAMATVIAMYAFNDSGVVVLALSAVFVGPFIVVHQCSAEKLEVASQ